MNVPRKEFSIMYGYPIPNFSVKTTIPKNNKIFKYYFVKVKDRKIVYLSD